MHFDIAVVGGGAMGTFLVWRLLQKAHELQRPLSILWVERERFACGVAYATPSDHHILNVPAGMMSAFSELPGHFLEWAQKVDPTITSETFVSRKLYGRYLQYLFEEMKGFVGDKRALLCEKEAIVDIEEKEGQWLLFGTNNRWRAEKVVLAMGNFAPRPVPLLSLEMLKSPYYCHDPVNANYQNKRSILLVGTGLTAIDQVVHLEKTHFPGSLHMISRTALIPYTADKMEDCFVPNETFNEEGGFHQIQFFPYEPSKKEFSSLLDWMHYFQGERKKRPDELGIDTLCIYRNALGALFRSLPHMNEYERKKLASRFMSYVNSLTHGMPKESAESFKKLHQSGVLTLHKGSLKGIKQTQDGLEVTFFNRKRYTEQTITCDYLVNCTGPEMTLDKIKEPLIVSMRSKGLMTPNLDGSICKTENYQPIDKDQQKLNNLWVVGSMVKPPFTRAIAVPSLRIMAEHLAYRLLFGGFPVLSTETCGLASLGCNSKCYLTI